MAEKVNVYDGKRLAVFAITEWQSKDKQRSGSRFTQIGSASVNRDGSVNMYLDLLPAQGQTLQLRTVKPREEQTLGQQPPAAPPPPPPDEDIPF